MPHTRSTALGPAACRSTRVERALLRLGEESVQDSSRGSLPPSPWLRHWSQLTGQLELLDARHSRMGIDEGSCGRLSLVGVPLDGEQMTSM